MGIAPVLPAVTLSILFIGNSLTASNDLPARLEEVARVAGRSLRTAAVTLPGASLDDHWDRGRARRAIREGKWDLVVLQQGPSTLPGSRAALARSTRRFAEEIRRAGGRPALLMVWPLPGQSYGAVSDSYRAAAEGADAVLFPAGEAWAIVHGRDTRLALTVKDGFHPSPVGTWLAALTIHCALFPDDRPTLPDHVRGPDGAALTPAQRQLLGEAACLAAREGGRGWPAGSPRANDGRGRLRCRSR